MKSKFIIFLFFFIKLHSQINFAPVENKWTGSWPHVVKIGDLNNDGLNDVVLGLTSHWQHPNNYSILVYLQNPNGTLADPVQYSYAVNYLEISSIDIGDLNQDGLNDILIGLQSPVSTSRFGIFYQNSNNTFDPLVSTLVSGRLERVRIADMNNDGKNDMIICHYLSIEVFYQGASGVFQNVTITKPYLFNQYVAMANMEIGDMNNDGKNDLVLQAPAFFKLYTYLNTNTGINPIPIVFDTGQLLFNGLAVGDVNNDGKKDVVLSRGPNNTSKIRILHQTSSPNLYTDQGEIPAYELPEAIKIGDLNNDGKNEIVTVHGGWVKLSTYTQNSLGNYSSYEMFDLPYASSYDEDGLAIGDINNDGKKDVVIANYNRGIDILYNISNIILNTSETVLDSELILYPNPCSDFLKIKYKEKIEKIEIFDMAGKILLSKTLEKEMIDIRNLIPGKYIIRITNKSHSILVKSFIKK